MIRKILFSLLSSVLLILTFSNFFIINRPFLENKSWILSWFGFVPLFFALKDLSKTKAFFIAYFTGIIFWLGVIYWLINVTFLGMIILVMYLALYFGIFGLGIAKDLNPQNFSSIKIGCLWITLEYIRSKLFSGFGWALLAYSQYLNLPIIQVADIFGSWIVSFLIILVNSTIYSFFLMGFRKAIRNREFILIVICLICCLTYGFFKISLSRDDKSRCRLKISVIQPNIPQEVKWDSLYRDWIFEKHINLTRRIEDRPHLIIWPEASLPVILEQEENYYLKIIRDFVKDKKTNLLFGAVTLKNNQYYNSAILLSSVGTTQYNKLHLVPFGEYIPLRNIFGFLERVVPIGDFTSGREYTVFRLEDQNCLLPINFSVLICFEDIFPEIASNFVRKGAKFLINITNDAWFKKSTSPYQHFSASVFRAVENRVYMIRSANTGISGFITPLGKISLLEDKTGKNIFIEGDKTEEINLVNSNLSFYSLCPDLLIILAVLVLVTDRLKILSRNKFINVSS